MLRNLDKPDVELGRHRAYEVLVRLGDLRDHQQASMPNFAHVRGQAPSAAPISQIRLLV